MPGLLLREGMRLVGVGVALGWLAFIDGSRLLSWIPARRAMRVDPVIALRYE